MKNLILKIILIGFILGLVGSTMTMTFGLMIYALLPASLVVTIPSFISDLAKVAVCVGVLLCFGWFGYVLFMARQYFFHILGGGADEETKK